MHYADQMSVVVIFISHALSVQLKGISNTDDQRDNQTMPFEIYLSFSHDPLVGNSKLITNENGKLITNQYQNRSKRGALQLYNMVVCATGCNPLVYKNYGCYCGFLGAGYPVDPIDRCCRMHDWCYDTAKCPMFLEYFVPYVWTCYFGQPLCAAGWSCSHRLCECDRKLAECLRTQPCPRRKAICGSSWRLFQNWRLL